MRKFLKSIRLWLPTIVILLFAAFTIIRIQTVQAALIEQLKNKQSKEVYQADKENLVRELNLIHKSLIRIEGKIDSAIITNHQTDIGTGRY